MFALITAMGLILGSWFVLFLMFSGVGITFQRLLGRQAMTGTLWLDSFWLGWGVVLLFLQLWHFIFPVNDLVFLLIFVSGIVSLYVYRHALMPIVRRLKQYRDFLMGFGILMVWLASRAIEMPTAYDTGFRDIQAVMWIDTYPIVPGLNNLFSSLAFNHPSYLYNALLDVSVWSGQSYYISTGLLFGVFAAWSVWSGVQLYRTQQQVNSVRWSWIVGLLLLPYVLFYTVRRGGISHFLTDTPVDLIGFLCVIYLLDFLQYYRLPDHDNRYLIWRLAFLISIGFTLKQSFIVFGLALGVLVFVVWIARGGLRHGVGRLVRIGLPVVLFGLVAMVPWMARGVVTSGYIAYPQSIGRFEVDWAEPQRLIEERQQMLATNTRLRYGDPDEVLSSWNWVEGWLRTLISEYIDFTLPVGLTILALGVYIVGALKNHNRKSQWAIGLWVLLPMVVMMVVWFFTAPNVKYIRYILWIDATIMVMLAVLVWTQIRWRWRVYAIFAVWGICMLYFAYLVVATAVWMPIPGENNGFHVRPQPPIKVVETNSGLELNVPDSHINQCWDIPLPCTPFPRTRIYERVPGDLRHGFGLTPRNPS